MKPEELQRLADEDLMPLVARKDPAAFEVFYDRHGGAAYSLAHRIVGDPAAAEDVTQEAFLSMWRSKARYDAARGSVRAWALGIVRNRAIDSLRRAGGHAPKLNLDDDAVLERRRRRSEPRPRPCVATRRGRSAARSVACPTSSPG